MQIIFNLLVYFYDKLFLKQRSISIICMQFLIKLIWLKGSRKLLLIKITFRQFLRENFNYIAIFYYAL